MTLVTVDDATFEAWLPENAERDALRENIPLMRQIVANQVISRRISGDDIPAGENLLVQTVDEVGLTFSKDEEGNNSVTHTMNENDGFLPFSVGAVYVNGVRAKAMRENPNTVFYVLESLVNLPSILAEIPLGHTNDI